MLAEPSAGSVPTCGAVARGDNAIPVIKESSHALRELRQERTLARLGQLLIAARESA